jgi:hypothetical protein
MAATTTIQGQASRESDPSTSELQKLRDRVDNLEVTAAEREKPWYRQAANILSILAIAVSTGVVLYQMTSEEHDKTLDDLQQIAVDIAENRKAVSEASLSATSNPSAAAIQQALEAKEVILLSRGVDLIHAYGGKIPAQVYFILSGSAETAGRYTDARDLLQRDVRSDASVPDLATAHVALGYLEMIPNTGVLDQADARSNFAQALKLMEINNDPLSLSARGWVHLSWGQGEFAAGNDSGALQQLATAEEVYTALPLTNPNRASGIQNVRQTRAFLMQTSDDGRRLAAALIGQWSVIPSGPGVPRTGTLTISLNPDSGALSATCSHDLPGGLLLPVTENGNVQIQDEQTALFVWQSSIPNFGEPTLAAGTTTLKISPDGKTLNATEQQENHGDWKYIFVKSAVSAAPRTGPTS